MLGRGMMVYQQHLSRRNKTSPPKYTTGSDESTKSRKSSWFSRDHSKTSSKDIAGSDDSTKSRKTIFFVRRHKDSRNRAVSVVEKRSTTGSPTKSRHMSISVSQLNPPTFNTRNVHTVESVQVLDDAEYQKNRVEIEVREVLQYPAVLLPARVPHTVLEKYRAQMLEYPSKRANIFQRNSKIFYRNAIISYGNARTLYARISYRNSCISRKIL